MFTRHKRIVLFVSAALALSFSAARVASRKHSAGTAPLTATASTQSRYVRSGALLPQLRWNLRAIGDRLEKPGKEQLVMAGTLALPGSSTASAVSLTLRTPSRISLTVQTGLQIRTITFDGTSASWAALSASDKDLVTTLFFDTAENFFFGQMAGSATRFLGFRFRPNAQSTLGPFHDIYAVRPINNLPSNLMGSKLFEFNSDSRLLDLVKYQIDRNGSYVPVEVRLSNWQDTNGQKVARRIERLENGTTVMTLIINSVVFAPSTNGGTL